MEHTKYKMIFETLRSEICSGKYETRKFLSEAQLVRRFGVARFTVVQALEGLRKAGLVVRRKGKGTFLTAFARTATGPIGLILPGLAYGEIFTPICSEVARMCQGLGRSVLLGNLSVDDPSARAEMAKKLAQDFVRQRVAGVIFHPIEYVCDSAGVNKEILAILEDAQVPVVLIDYDVVSSPARSRYDVVGIDNVASGRRLAEHVLAQGAKSALFVKRKDCASTVEQRLLGVAEAFRAAGRAWGRRNVVVAEPSACGAALKALKGMPKPCAVVCGYDLHAVGVLKALERARSLAVPRDVLLAGFDDVQCARVMSPSLTTIHQPCVQIAQTAVEVLMRRMRKPESAVLTLLLDAPLVVRESTGCRPAV